MFSMPKRAVSLGRSVAATALAATAIFLLGASPPARAEPAAAPAPIDWSAWRELPVFYRGRIMPLDTLARTLVEKIVGRTAPTLDLETEFGAERAHSSDLVESRKLFPGDKPRKFQPAELLFSWLVEPERWDDVPFLPAANEELRAKLLGLPVRNAAGEHLRYVSPRQVRESDELAQRLGELAQAQRDAEQAGESFDPKGVDRKCSELFEAYSLYRSLLLEPTLDPGARAQFQKALRTLAGVWSEFSPQVEGFGQLGGKNALGDLLTTLRGSLDKVAELAERDSFELAEGEAACAPFSEAAEQVARWFATNRQRLIEQPPPDWDAEQVAKVRTLFDGLATQSTALSAAATALHRSLYDNSKPLRVVPALNAAALERGRTETDDSQPWLDLHTVLFGSPRALAEYPAAEVQAVQEAFRRAAATYRERQPSTAGELARLAAALRRLGERTEPVRAKLELKDRDEELIRYTAYPVPGYTATEARYNTLDPFKWAWVVSLLSLVAFTGVFVFSGGGGPRRMMFWLGVLVLLAGAVWSAYGFWLRIAITHWAPVTNMYETVIYVPFVVSVLGAWFALLPISWPALASAWRLTALPGTWEETPLSKEQTALASPGAWRTLGMLLVVPRVALSVLLFLVLAVWSYAAGARTIINLLPVVDVGSRLPDLNDLMTWFTGLCVLVPTVWLLPRAVLSLVLGVVLLLVKWSRLAGRTAMQAAFERWPFALSAAAMSFVGYYIAWYSSVLDKNFSPLMPVLRDNFWLLIHVLTIVSSYAAGVLALGLGNVALAFYLFGRYRPRAGAPASSAHLLPPVACATLAGFVYKAIQVAVVLLAAGTILGALWADVAWGRFWGWDPKEVWALISLLLYVAILHGRYAGVVGNFGLVLGTVVGATGIIMSWYGVNFVLGQGLHSYGFGEDQTANWYVAGGVVLQWVFLGLAAGRYAVQSGLGWSALTDAANESDEVEVGEVVGESAG